MIQACVTGKKGGKWEGSWGATKEAEWAVREHRESGKGVSVQGALWGTLPVTHQLCSLVSINQTSFKRDRVCVSLTRHVCPLKQTFIQH